MTVLELTDATFDEVVGASSVPVLVDVAGESAGELVVARLDVEEHPDTVRRLGVMSFPTLLLFVDGAERGRVIGARGKARLREDLRTFLA